jgi:uncharacterized protein YkwD
VRQVLRLVLVLAGVLLVTAPVASAAAPTRAERRIVQLINHERVKRGLRPLRLNGHLVDAARYHSREMLRDRYFAHDSLHPGRSWDARIRSFLACPTVGEAIAWGSGLYATPYVTVRMWMASTAHRRILLDPAFRTIGVGRARGTYGGSRHAVLVTADFGT